jgi:hypothetical protein
MRYPKDHKIKLIHPISAGDQLMSLKPRPNAACVCNSGKKQKKCCGVHTRYASTDKMGMRNLPKPEPAELKAE